MSRAVPLFLLLASALAAQPLLYYRSAANAASSMPQILPGGGIAQGSVFSVQGSGLGPTTAIEPPGYPLAPSLGGTTISIIEGTRSLTAYPIYVSSNEIVAIMPSSAPIGMSSIVVTANGSRSNPLPVLIVDDSFGIFSMNGDGVGPAVLQNSSEHVNSPVLAAAPGQPVTLFGTGLGGINAPDNTPLVSGTSLTTPVEVFVGGQSATVSYSGRASCCAGVDEIKFTVPANAPLGCWVPVYVRTSGTIVSNVATMAVQKNGGTCSDTANPFSHVIVSGGTTGAFVAVRATTHEDVGTITPVDVATDFQASTFYSQKSAPYAFNSGMSLPPPGTCTAYTVAGDLLSGNVELPAFAPNGSALNGGPITLTGPNGSAATTVSAFSSLPQFLLGYFGGTIAGTTISGGLALNPGTYQVSGNGSGIGAFKATLKVPAPITWTGEDSLATVDRSQPLTVAWSGGSATDRVGLVGFGVDLPGNATSMFVCIAQSGASSITVSPAILANLPATRANPLQSEDVLYLISVPGSAAVPITATGLTAGAALFTYIDGKTVIYQ